MTRTALICGVSGQDGAYLAQLLLSKGYTVHGTSRDSEASAFRSLIALGIRDLVTTHSMQVTDFRSVLNVLTRVRPDEVYNLSGQTSVGLSFDQPVETFESITVGAINILECLRYLEGGVRFYNAASSEVFGDTGSGQATEATPFQPRSPYAMAKAAAFWATANYREAYGIHACSGLLFNHESPLRPARFVTQKVIAAAVRIARGSTERLRLGDLGIRRDWGWAPEYVDAMWRMLQQDRPEDFVVATGQSAALEDFVSRAFECLDLRWGDHVDVDRSLYRPSEIRSSAGNASKAERVLGWKASVTMPEVVRRMIEAEVRREGQGRAGHAKQD